MPAQSLPDDAILVGGDTETFRIGPGAVAPKLVCLALATEKECILIGNGEPRKMREALVRVLRDNVHLVWHNAAYDLTVLHEFYRKDQAILDLLWDSVVGDRQHCTKIREKLLNLSRWGNVKFRPLPDGTSVTPIRYHLYDLAEHHLSKDRKKEKTDDAGDSWRMNFSALDGERASDYPEEARDYVIEDAGDPLQIFLAQDEEAESEHGHASCKSDRFRTALDFALRMSTVEGFRIDSAEVERVQAVVDDALDPEKAAPLYKCGVLIRGNGCRPHKRQEQAARGAAPIAPGLEEVDWSPVRKDLEAKGIKFVEATDDKINQRLLRDMVEIQCATLGMEVLRTDPSEKFPNGQISIKRDVLKDLAPHNPLIELLYERGRLLKLATSYLPALREVERVHPNYDVCKRSGRTSSYGGLDAEDDSRGDLYPSVNIQQPHPLVRSCYIPEPGHVLCSIDFNYIELVCWAQVCLDLFGHSTLADKINAGMDPHAYLGGVIAAHLDAEYANTVQRHGVFGDWDENYKLFKRAEGHKNKKLASWFKGWRDMGKPTGLGFPGGLGPETFVAYAKAQFGVDLVKMEGDYESAVARASTLREIWRATYPESRLYSAWVNEQLDPFNEDKFCFTSPFGMHRAACDYTQIANGAGLQTPTSDGVNLCAIWLQWSIYHSLGSLYGHGARMVALLHDEFLFSFPRKKAHQLAYEAAKIMTNAMRNVMRDVKVTANPILMLRWNKNAKQRFRDGKLIPFEEADDQTEAA